MKAHEARWWSPAVDLLGDEAASAVAEQEIAAVDRERGRSSDVFLRRSGQDTRETSPERAEAPYGAPITSPAAAPRTESEIRRLAAVRKRLLRLSRIVAVVHPPDLGEMVVRKCAASLVRIVGDRELEAILAVAWGPRLEERAEAAPPVPYTPPPRR